MVQAQFTVADFEKGKVVLNDQNWNTEIKKHKFILVEFYSPQCPYCQKFKPEFDAAAEMMLKMDPPVPMGVYNILENQGAMDIF